MKKIIRIGKVPCNSRKVDLFISIELTDGKLSISGVEGPRSNGDAAGSCGQVDMGYAHRNPADNDRRYTSPTAPAEIDFAPGWTADKWLDLLDVWHKWHLNDMKPGCEHQTGPEWDTQKELTIYHWQLADNILFLRREAKRSAAQAIKSGVAFVPTAEHTRAANLPDSATTETDCAPSSDYVANGPHYTGDHYNKASEVKTAGWVYPKEHSGGLLCKPCPVCGYKYGAEWRKVEVPASVIAFIESLPDADAVPAWV